MLLLLVIACYRPPGPAPAGSPAALLASQTAEAGRQAALLAAHTEEIEGWIDEWRAATPEARPEIEQRIQVKALELQAEAEALRDRVYDIEEQASVWDE